MQLPDGLEYVRTVEFDHETIPPGLRKAHRVAEATWGNLVVRQGSLGFVFEDEPTNEQRIEAGEAQTIPPGRMHHVVLLGDVLFAIEFYRVPSE